MQELPFRHVNRNNVMPARDARRFEVPILDPETAEIQVAHSVDFEDHPSDDRNGRYNAKPYGPSYLKLVESPKAGHLLDDPQARERWTYQNPAQAVIRLGNKDL